MFFDFYVKIFDESVPSRKLIAKQTYSSTITGNGLVGEEFGFLYETRETDQEFIYQQKKYYEILNVDANATSLEIKKAYHVLAKQYHPDTSKDIRTRQKFIEISEAYKVLSDPEKRKEYDLNELS